MAKLMDFCLLFRYTPEIGDIQFVKGVWRTLVVKSGYRSEQY